MSTGLYNIIKHIVVTGTYCIIIIINNSVIRTVIYRYKLQKPSSKIDCAGVFHEFFSLRRHRLKYLQKKKKKTRASIFYGNI